MTASGHPHRCALDLADACPRCGGGGGQRAIRRPAVEGSGMTPDPMIGAIRDLIAQARLAYEFGPGFYTLR